MSTERRLIDLSQGSARLPLKVAFVGRYPPSCSGAPNSAAELVRALTELFGIEVEVIRLVEPGDEGAPGPPVTVEVNPHWQPSAQVAASRSNQADVLIIQWEPVIPAEFVEELINQSQAPVVIVLSDPAPGDPDAIHRIARLPAVHTLVVPSESTREALEAVLGDMVDLEVVPYGAAWQALDPPDRLRRCVLTWGFLRPGMGIERAIEAISRLRDLAPPVQLRVIGVSHPYTSYQEAAAYRDQLQSLAEELEVGAQVEFHPVILSREELIDQIASCDVVTVTYDNQHQTASRIVSEAIAAGRPVVATRFPGATELLSGGAGITVPYDDPDQLAEALRTLLTDDDIFAHAYQCACRLSSNLSWRAVAERMANILLHATEAPVATEGAKKQG